MNKLPLLRVAERFRFLAQDAPNTTLLQGNLTGGSPTGSETENIGDPAHPGIPHSAKSWTPPAYTLSEPLPGQIVILPDPTPNLLDVRVVFLGYMFPLSISAFHFLNLIVHEMSYSVVRTP